jgi:hypothetical protein
VVLFSRLDPTEDKPAARVTVVHRRECANVLLCKLFEVEVQPLEVVMEDRVLLELLRVARSCSDTRVDQRQSAIDDLAVSIERLWNSPPSAVPTLATSNASQSLTHFEVACAVCIADRRC